MVSLCRDGGERVCLCMADLCQCMCVFVDVDAVAGKIRKRLSLACM